MRETRYMFAVLGVLFSSVSFSAAQVSIGIGSPNVSIGISVSSYPDLVPVPGYPVYYAPQLDANFFFYDGMYWIFLDDNWYASTWYNGPWWIVEPDVVPVFILRIPVRYYRHPPAYFRGWRPDSPPRWGDHWGRDWERHRRGWDRWDRRSVPAPAPLPGYQRQYSGRRYPGQVERQYELQQRNYRYQPRDPLVQQHYQRRPVEREPARHGMPQQGRQGAPEERGAGQRDIQRSAPPSQVVPAPWRAPSPREEREDFRRPAPVPPQQARPEFQDRRPQPQPELDQRGRRMPAPQGQERRERGGEATREPGRKQGEGQERERGRDRDD